MLITFFQKLIKLCIASDTNAAVIEISESKLDETIIRSEIQISNYELLR